LSDRAAAPAAIISAGERAKSINAIMQRKLSLLYEIYKQTAQEYSYVCSEDIDLFGNVIAEKQALINEIDFLDRRFLDEYSSLKDALGLPPQGAAAELRGAAGAGGAGGGAGSGSRGKTGEGEGEGRGGTGESGGGGSAGAPAGAAPGLADLKLNTAEIMAILAKIEDLDKKINQKIVKLREDLAADLIRLSRQRRVSSVYSNEKPGRNGGTAPVAAVPYRAVFDKKK
jgi:hypothetical protein